MLVDARLVADFHQFLPARNHGISKVRNFPVGHPIEVNGHRKCRHLVIWNATAGISIDHELDFIAR